MYPQLLSLKPDKMLTIASSTVLIFYVIHELMEIYLGLFPTWFLTILGLGVAITVAIKVHFEGVQRVYLLKVLAVFIVSQTLFTIITISLIKGSGLHYEIGATKISFYELGTVSVYNFLVMSFVVIGNISLAIHPLYRGLLRLRIEANTKV